MANRVLNKSLEHIVKVNKKDTGTIDCIQLNNLVFLLFELLNPPLFIHQNQTLRFGMPTCSMEVLTINKVFLVIYIGEKETRLTYFQSMFHVHTPCKHQKTAGFQMFSGGMEVKHWLKMGCYSEA